MKGGSVMGRFRRCPRFLCIPVGLLIGLVLTAGTDAAADAIDYTNYIRGIVNTEFMGYVYDVFVRADHAYVLAGRDFLVYDVSTPEEPALLGGMEVGMFGKAISVSGFFAYVATGSTLSIIRIVNPSHPELTGLVSISGDIEDVAAAFGYAYIVSESNGLHVVDATDPWSPAAVGYASAPGAQTVAVYGDAAYVGSNSARHVFDVSDPTNPIQVEQTPSNGEHNMVVEEGFLYLTRQANAAVMEVYDLTNPFDPLGTSVLSLFFDEALGLAVDYPYAFAGTYGLGMSSSLEIIDVSDPYDLTVLARTAPALWRFKGFDAEEGYVYVEEQGLGMAIVDVSAMQAVEPIEVIETLDYAIDVESLGDYALVADRYAALTVVDLVGGQGVVDQVGVGTTFHVYLHGELAFTLGTSGVSIVDVSDPLHSVRLSTISTPGTPFEIAVHGDYAYVADGEAKLTVIDISDPANPSLVTTWDAPIEGEVRGIDVDWPFVYLGHPWHELLIADVTDPANPIARGRALSGLPGYGLGGDVAVSGGYAYCADGYSGLWVADVSDPDNPTVVGLYPNSVTLYCRVEGSFLYTARLDLGFQIWDISDPEDLVLIGGADNTGQAYGIAISTDWIVVADERSGILLFPLHDYLADIMEEETEAPGTNRFALWPNPTHGELRIEFDQPEMNPLTAEIVDLGGRRIRSLVAYTSAGSGRHILQWDGLDARGHQVVPGVYFVRMGDTKRRFVVLR
jgi:hypothetical protein